MNPVEKKYSTKFEDHAGLLRKLAWANYKWASALFMTDWEFDDCYQHACVSFCVARDRFDPNNGNGFTAYLGMVVRNQFKNEVIRTSNRQGEIECMTHIAANSCDVGESEEESVEAVAGQGMYDEGENADPLDSFIAMEEFRERMNKFSNPLFVKAMREFLRIERAGEHHQSTSRFDAPNLRIAADRAGLKDSLRSVFKQEVREIFDVYIKFA